MKVTISECNEVIFERLWVERVALDEYGLLVVYENGSEVFRCRLYAETTFTISDRED